MALRDQGKRDEARNLLAPVAPVYRWDLGEGATDESIGETPDEVMFRETVP